MFCSIKIGLYTAALCIVLFPVTHGFLGSLQHHRTRGSSMPHPSSAHSTAIRLKENDDVPKLIVFDLDNTIWTPELYQLRKIQRSGHTPVAGRDVTLLPGAVAALDRKRGGDLDDIQYAVASRTKSVQWAHDLLDQFGLRDLLVHVEIFPGDKQQHFRKIHEATGIAYRDMLFFDDARDGKYGNCEPVAAMGVMAVHCPRGLTSAEVFDTGIQRFQEWDKRKGAIVESNGSVSTIGKDSEETLSTERQSGTVKFVNVEKRYGFLLCENRRKDLFFHFNGLTDTDSVKEGDKLSFSIEKDSRNGKIQACAIARAGTNSAWSHEAGDTLTMPAFSMNMPFAALLTNEYKVLESRNGTMFQRYPEGTQMILHVGRRTYPDGDAHLEVMKSGGFSDGEINELKTLPRGYGRGMAVAICELGRTYETTTEERSDPDMQRKIAAFGKDSGRIVTEIKRIEYLKQPFTVAAQGGVFQLKISCDLIPSGWRDVDGKNDSATSTGKRKKSPVYSISG